jgi:hypothetical protein
MDVDGTLSVKAEPSNPHPMDPAYGRVDFTVSVAGVHSSLSFAAYDDYHDGAGVEIIDADLSGFDADTNGSSFTLQGTGGTDLITGPTGVDVPATISMSLKFTHYQSGFPGQSIFSGDFGHTFSWATGRPVFDLPPGYTVNGMGIVDNRYVVPEPASGCAALFMALVGLFCRRNRY